MDYQVKRRNQRQAEKVVASFLEEKLVERFRYFLQHDRAVRRQLNEAALAALDEEEKYYRGQPIHDKLAHQLPVHFAQIVPAFPVWDNARKHLIDTLEDYGLELSFIVRRALACREEHKDRLLEGEALYLAREINHGKIVLMGDYVLSSDSHVGEMQMTKNWERLNAREQRVMRLRLGLDDKHPRTHKEVGAVLNVTHERVREIEAKALRTLWTGFGESAAAKG